MGVVSPLSGCVVTEATVGERLKQRQVKIWQGSYLVYRYLWENLSWAISDVRARVAELSPIVLDVGCGEAPYKDLFGDARYIGMNYDSLSASPDICGDALSLPVRENSVDIVLASQVIEHVRNPFVMLSEIFRVLQPGGYLVLSAPFYWPIHEAPHDYFRFTHYGLSEVITEAGLEIVELRADGGDRARLATSIAINLPGKRWAAVRLMLNVSALLWPGKNEPTLPLNYTLIARKPAAD